VVATGVAADGHREVLGFEVDDSEDGAFWTAFLRSLKTRGLARVQLVISDAHAGLKNAIASVLFGASWQRCRVHFLRNVLAAVPKGSAEMVAAAIRTIFAQPSPAHVHDQLEVIAAMPGRQFPKPEAILREAVGDITAFAAFPVSHWKKIWSTNPLERLNKEIKRRTDLARVFPKSRSAATAGRRGPGRSSRRMAGQRTPLPVGSLHGPAHHLNSRTEGGSHPSTSHGIVSTSPLTRSR
jgi:putative transposase